LKGIKEGTNWRAANFGSSLALHAVEQVRMKGECEGEQGEVESERGECEGEWEGEWL